MEFELATPCFVQTRLEQVCSLILVNSREHTRNEFVMSPPTHKLGASRNTGTIFLTKRNACGNVPTSQGLPRSWYQEKTESPRGGASRFAGGYRGLQAPRQGIWGAGSPPGRARGLGGGSPAVKTILWTQNHLPKTFNHLPTTFNRPPSHGHF